MKKTKIVPGEIIVIEDVLCNICNKSCRKHTTVHDNGSEQHSYEFAEVDADWGFFSTKDSTRYSAHICEACFDKHLVPLINFEKEEPIYDFDNQDDSGSS